MSRTSRSVPGARRITRLPALAAVAVAAGLVITGCTTSHTGAAAVVDGHRIEVGTVNSKVSQVADAQQAVGVRPVPGVQASREQLTDLLRARVLDEAARRAGVGVTRTEITNNRHALEAQSPVPLTTRAAAGGVAPADIDAVIRQNLIVDKLVAAKGVTPGTQQAHQVATAIMMDTAKSMKVSLNPRYGTWDAAALSIGPTTYSWLTPDSFAGPQV